MTHHQGKTGAEGWACASPTLNSEDRGCICLSESNPKDNQEEECVSGRERQVGGTGESQYDHKATEWTVGFRASVLNEIKRINFAVRTVYVRMCCDVLCLIQRLGLVKENQTTMVCTHFSACVCVCVSTWEKVASYPQ